MLQSVAEMFSDGLAILEILFLKETIHQSDCSRGRCVLLIDGPAFHDLGANGVEISRAYTQPGSAMVRGPRRWRWFAFKEYTLAPVISLHGTIERKTDLLNSGDSTYVVMELPVKGLKSVRFVPSHLWI